MVLHMLFILASQISTVYIYSVYRVYRLGTSLFGVFDAASTYLIAHLTNLILFYAISVDNITIHVAPSISTVEMDRLELLLPSNTAQLQHIRRHFFN